MYDILRLKPKLETSNKKHPLQKHQNLLYRHWKRHSCCAITRLFRKPFDVECVCG